MKRVTDRQKEVLNYVRKFININNYSPTLREVATAFNISVPAARDHIRALEKKGKVTLSNNRSRSIDIVGESSNHAEVISIPILGDVAAGVPILSKENYNGSIEMFASDLGRGNFFALRVKGYSMQDAGVLDGDIAIIKKQQTAENRDIVVAVLDDDSYTLKRFYRESNRIKLKAENPEFSPIYTRDVTILGKLKCIIRKYD